MTPDAEQQALRDLERLIDCMDIQTVAFSARPGPSTGSDLLGTCQRAMTAYLAITWTGPYARAAHTDLYGAYISAINAALAVLSQHIRPIRAELDLLEQQDGALSRMLRDAMYWRDDAR